MPKLPVSPMKVVSLVGEVRHAAGGPSRVLVMGTDAQAVEKVRAALVLDPGHPERGGGHSPAIESVVLEPGGGIPRDAYADEVAVDVLVASIEELSENGMRSGLSELAAKQKPAVVVLREAPGCEISFPGVGASRVVGISMDGRPPADILAEAVVDAAGEAAVPLAARLPSLREETCRRIVGKTATQNAVIGTLFFLPGADMPVMTMNEARMVLRLAAAHGEELGIERAVELLSIVGAGFGLRTIARQMLDLLPGPGWALKGAFAYSGTRAMGRAARLYFDSGQRITPSRLEPLVEKIKMLRR